MANTKISALAAISVVAVDDVLPIVDTSETATKKITVDQLKAAVITAGGGGRKVLASDFVKTGDTTLANAPGLTVDVVASTTYIIRAVLHTADDTTGGCKFAISGTATATSIIYQVFIWDVDGSFDITDRCTALDTAVGNATEAGHFTRIEGSIVVNVGGTLTLQFAQNANSGHSDLLAGSTFEVSEAA